MPGIASGLRQDSGFLPDRLFFTFARRQEVAKTKDMAGYRVYVDPLPMQGTFELEGSENHHLTRVLRAQEGETVVAFDGRGAAHQCRLATIGKRVSQLEREKDLTVPPPLPLTLMVALLKGKSYDQVLRHAVEIGLERIVPLRTRFCEVRLDNRETETKAKRWGEICLEACKQSGNLRIPILDTPKNLPDALNVLHGPALIASLKEMPKPLFQTLQTMKRPTEGQTVHCLVGPEGDFSSEEYDQIQSAGAHAVSLGPHVLRSETAALVLAGTTAQWLATE